MNTGTLKLYVMTVICVFACLYLTFNPNDVATRYKENGIEVEATISSVKVTKKGHRRYTCYYLDKNGEEVYANLILNQTSGSVGDKVYGAYLPEDPGSVYCQPSNAMKFGVMAGFYLITIILIALSVVSLKTTNKKVEYVNERPINTPVKPTYVSDPFDSFDYKANENASKDSYDVNSSLVRNEKSVEESETKSSSGLKLKL